MFTCTVTIELPLSEQTITKIEAAKAVHSAKQAELTEEERKPFTIMEMYGLTSVINELNTKTREGRDKLTAEMAGWKAAPDYQLYVGKYALQVRQVFTK